MAKNFIKQIPQISVYDFETYPFSKGQKFYTDEGNVYEDIVLNELEANEKKYRVATVAPKMISESAGLPSENNSLKNSFIVLSDDGVYKIYYYDANGGLNEVGESLSTGWTPPTATTYDILEFDGASWNSTKILNRINEIKRTDRISFAEYDNDNSETGNFLGVHPLKYNNANGSLLIDTNKIWDDSDFSSQDITNWNTAHGWGDHSLEGYLISESDPIFTAWDKSTGISITESQISDLQNYLTEATDQELSLIDNGTGTWISGVSVNDHAITLNRTNTTTSTITVGKLISSGDLEVNGGNITFSTPELVLGASGRTVTIPGNLEVQGTTTSINTAELDIDDSIILINSNQTGTPSSVLIGGLEIERGDLANYQFVFVEDTDDFRIGQVGDLQPVVTRDPNGLSNNKIPYWDESDKTLKDSNIYFDGSNIGIGSANPTQKLEVESESVWNIRSTIVSNTLDGAYGALQLVKKTGTAINNNFGVAMSFASMNSSDEIENLVILEGIVDNGERNGAFTIKTSNDGSNLERMRVSSTGNIGINTTSPTNKLDIDGTTRSRGKMTVDSIIQIGEMIIEDNVTDGFIDIKFA